MASIASSSSSNWMQSHSTRRAATHWLFSHLPGASAVLVPDTALFDEEGVLEAWLHTKHTPAAPATAQKANTKKRTGKTIANGGKTKPAMADVVVTKHGFLELNLLRLEAHLQGLHKHATPNTAVAVVYDTVDDDAPPRFLTETALDATIRSLCGRERAMTSTEPSLMVLPRQYAGGAFALQAAMVPLPPRPQAPARGRTIPSTITIQTRFQRGNATSSDSCAHVVKSPSPGSDSDGDGEEERDRLIHGAIDLANVFASAEAQCAALSEHFAACHGVVLHRMTLEFVHVVADGDLTTTTTTTNSFLPQVYLTCARQVEWTVIHRTGAVPLTSTPREPRRDKPTKKTPEDRKSTTSDTRNRHNHYRVCRQCRAPIEVDLARELIQKQTLLRSVLAKYQEMSERHADAETRCKDAQSSVAHKQARIDRLEEETSTLRGQLTAQADAVDAMAQKQQTLAVELVETVEQKETAQREVEVAHVRIQELVQWQHEQLQVVHKQGDLQAQLRHSQDVKTSEEIRLLRVEMDILEKPNRKLEIQSEEARAAFDEVHFQWGFVVRKLTDVSDKGVFPPKRVAGGFSSYPTPSPQNVEQVVKWLVDYQAKKTVLDAQQPQRQHAKSIKRRLQMKVELMRILANGGGGGGESPTRTRRRKSSRSPRKRSSRSPSRRPTELSAAVKAMAAPTLMATSRKPPDDAMT